MWVLSSEIFFFHLDSKYKLEIALDRQEVWSSEFIFFHLESALWYVGAIKYKEGIALVGQEVWSSGFFIFHLTVAINHLLETIMREYYLGGKTLKEIG